VTVKLEPMTSHLDTKQALAGGGKPLLGIAADHATERVPTARPGQQIGEVRAELAGRKFDSAGDVVVLEGEALAGVVPIERLLAADEAIPIAEVMDSEPPVVAAGADQELVAWRMIRRGESSIAVVDEAGRFGGLIPPNRLLAVLLAEHDEDLARLGGYLAGTARARLAAEEPVGRRLLHRLPWLLIGLLGAMASAGIVGAFESQLEAVVMLAFFVPGVVYMADAVGTQTEALLIRGLSVGVELRPVVRRELATGLVIGFTISTAFFPFALAVWGDGQVALAVALALLASCSIATLVAMLLPWGFQRLGQDPAFGSGPLATVVQDLLSIVVYFAIATAIVT
jgi:magnesium transporter